LVSEAEESRAEAVNLLLLEGPAGCMLGAGDSSSRGVGGGLRTLQSGFVVETLGI